MAGNRRLVPMPTRRAVPAPPAFEPVYKYEPEYEPVAAPRRSRWDNGLAAKIRSTPPWVLFLWLALTAAVYAYVGKLILFIIGFVLFVRDRVWLSMRFPLTMLFANSFIAALLGGGRQRR